MQFDLLDFEELESTNDTAKDYISRGLVSSPIVVHTQRQKKGRGTRGRLWESYEGNVHASYVFELPRGMVAQLVVFPVALAVLDFLNGLLKPGMVRVKWPNDLLVDKQKICGALHEIERYQGKTYIVSGIGVNLVDYPKADVSYPATSLREYTNEVPTSLDAAMDIGRRIRGRLNLLSHHGFEMLRAEYLDNAFGYRERISVAFGKERSNVIQGVFTDISAEGALVLATDSGEKKIFTGDVFPDLL